ncbi:MAG: AI-2E family transporter [Candidatus Nomurabacteria bacterium]|nr:MAG: AI-2E family transporter [Candidatus Nomurabacteria bacterium]
MATQNNNNEVFLRVTTSGIVKVLVILLFVAALFLIRDVIAIVFISLVFASALDPWVDWLQRKGIPRVLGIIILYTILLGVISLTVVLFVPLVADQVKSFSDKFPTIYNNVINGLNIQNDAGDQTLLQNIQETLNALNQSLVKITGSIFAGVVNLFGGIFTLFGVLVLTFYMTLEEQGIKKFVQSVAPAHWQPYIIQVINRIQHRLGLWLRGQLILSLIIGVMTFIGLSILGVNFAIVLSLIAGITEFIPIAGPFIGAIPAVLVAFTQSPIKALLVIILYIIIQQLENNLIVPKVMQKVTGLNPVVVIVVMLIGAKLAGIVGVILAIPVTIIANAFLEDFLKEKKAEQNRLES